MKRILSSIFVLLFLFLLSISASAKNKSDLQQSYNDLSRYLYTPYFSDSQYFADYEAQMKNTGLLLSKSDSTESEINAQYDALKLAYTNLMHDAFDYSLLEALIVHYESLDITLFEEDQWRKLSDVMEDVYDEYTAPTMFKKGTSTKESYAQDIEKHISKFRADFRTQFNNLKLKPVSENITSGQLLSLVNYCQICAPENLMKSSSYWNEFSTLANQAKILSSNENVGSTTLYEAASALLQAYKNLTNNIFDLSPITNLTASFQQQNQNQNTDASWKRYKNAIEELYTILNTPQFLYLSNLSDDEDPNVLIKTFFEKKAQKASEYFGQLVKQEDVNKLSVLCNTYHNVSASVGLDVKLKNLLDCVDAGYQVLKNENASNQEVQSAIKNIETAAEDLVLAEKYLKNETAEHITNDVKTIQLIIIFASVTLFLSLALACILSYRKFGRLIWNQ